MSGFNETVPLLPDPSAIDLWPTDLYLLRHAKPDRENVPRPDVNDPDWEIETQLIDRYQDLDPLGFRQAVAVGQRLAVIAPFAEFCISSDSDRSLQTSWEVVAQYPEARRPVVVDDSLARERYRGADSPILISKDTHTEQFPDKAKIRATTPSQWYPRGGEPFASVHLRQNMLLDFFSMYRPNEKQLIISTSGEFCIAAFNNPNLGNMSDAQLVEGFGPGMPATEYELTAITRYTKRLDPENEGDTNITDTYGYMRVMTPNAAEPEGDLAWDTGWLPVSRP